MPNLRVNIWHCDKDGLYSGYSQANFLRIHRSFIVPTGRVVAIKNKSVYVVVLQLPAGSKFKRALKGVVDRE